MLGYRVTDWDDAYENTQNIPGGDAWPEKWVAPAAKFRDDMAGSSTLDIAYGQSERQRLDVFRPNGASRGLLVFVHGGYWARLDKSFFSHMASGAVAAGYTAALPSYDLCPTVRVADITGEIGRAVTKAAEMVDGPIHIAGHSAGGHLVSRMMCTDAPLDGAVRTRLKSVTSISGLHDLRPIMRLERNTGLGIDEAEAQAESPALLAPQTGVRLVCWVGAMERAEFLRQNALLANIWRGLGATTDVVEEPDRHHFDVIDGLTDPRSPLMRAVLGGA
ncbi:MAG: alpha/beta hydrolase [Pseudomonadota bacterium]